MSCGPRVVSNRDSARTCRLRVVVVATMLLRLGRPGWMPRASCRHAAAERHLCRLSASIEGILEAL